MISNPSALRNFSRGMLGKFIYILWQHDYLTLSSTAISAEWFLLTIKKIESSKVNIWNRNYVKWIWNIKWVIIFRTIFIKAIHTIIWVKIFRTIFIKSIHTIRWVIIFLYLACSEFSPLGNKSLVIRQLFVFGCPTQK